MLIKYETELDDELVEKILALLEENGDLTILEISRLLGEGYEEGSEGWDKLKLHLWYMEDLGYLEERHFGPEAEDWDRVTDYSLEQTGIELALKTNKKD